MFNFSEMMELLMDEGGAFANVELPTGYERAGVVTPAMLMLAARQPEDPFNSALLEAATLVMESVYDYIDTEVVNRQDVIEAAEEFIGRECPTGGDPLSIADMLKVRLSWNLMVVDETMTVRVWQAYESALTRLESGELAIMWPSLQANAHFWPPRILNQTLRDALFSAGLHSALSHTTIHSKH